MFADHRDAGVLGVLPPGAPTNSVAGDPAADLARDPDTWRMLLVSPPAQPGAEAVSAALTGRPGLLAPLPGGEIDDAPVNAAMVAALWPALWGHGLKDVWGLGDDAFPAGAWAADNLVPEGPWPAVRIGDQPFGLLPTTSLRRWVAQQDDPPIEARLVPFARDVRRGWAEAAEAAGTSIGANTERLLDLIGRVPLSRGYAWRWMVPLENIAAITWGVDGGVTWPNLVNWWDALAAPVLQLGRSPARRYGTLGWPQDLDLPLVEPDNLPRNMTLRDAIVRIALFPPSQFASEGGLRELFPELPNSLLLRLLIQAALVNAAEVARWAKNVHGPMLDPVWFDNKVKPVIAAWGQQYAPSLLGADPASEQLKRGNVGTFELAEAPAATLERVLRATLDSAMYRIDPWVIGIAWRRLRTLEAATVAPRFRLGAYGWVDAPRPRSVIGAARRVLPRPVGGTGAHHRDPARPRVVRRRADPLADRYGVRRHPAGEGARRRGERGGAPGEAVGRAVERAVGDRSRWKRCAPSSRSGPNTPAAALRRACGAPARREQPGLARADPRAAHRARRARRGRRHLRRPARRGRRARRGERSRRVAGAAMEAAAGLGAPPELGVLRTQRTDRPSHSTVFVALRDGALPRPSTPPRARAAR